MPDFNLISHHLCPYVQRAVIVLLEKDIPHERQYIDLANKQDWFRAVSPLGRVPILQVAGAVLFESQVIAEYLDEVTEGSLHPEDPLERARHRSWIEYGSETLKTIGAFYNAPDSARFKRQRQALQARFSRIEAEIAGPYFAGDRFHMVDGVWGTIFRYLDVFDQIGDFAVLDGLKQVEEWRRAVSQRPSVKAAPPEGYAERLTIFLQNRDSHISTYIS